MGGLGKGDSIGVDVVGIGELAVDGTADSEASLGNKEGNGIVQKST